MRPRQYCPRTRGGGPHLAIHHSGEFTLSPHARGWTVELRHSATAGSIVPARAGVDRKCRGIHPSTRNCPRTRGGGPTIAVCQDGKNQLSPHARGWTADGRDGGDIHAIVPARAGVDRPRSYSPGEWPDCPRTRGGGPTTGVTGLDGATLSPHARGWTAGHVQFGDFGPIVPARAGVDRQCTHGADGVRIVPARAGVDRSVRRWLRWETDCPRTRGGGPEAWHIGYWVFRLSPHARGWTARGSMRGVGARIVPARAGVDRLLMQQRPRN